MSDSGGGRVIEGGGAALVLFDIDGTLVRRAGPHHRQALVDAVREVTGMETTTEHIPVHGMLDRDILSRMLRDAGAPASKIRAAMPEIVERAQALYVRSVPNLERKTCPGVRLLLRRLAREGVPMGLVTGNLTRIGWKKMERAGLREYFQFGAFAEMARDRAGLVRLAMGQARGRGWRGTRETVSVIGDSPNDILAAQANRVRAVAVHTGISTRAELARHSPDLLLADLRELRLEMLL
jgi:phosphoglycolate phosphatase